MVEANSTFRTSIFSFYIQKRKVLMMRNRNLKYVYKCEPLELSMSQDERGRGNPKNKNNQIPDHNVSYVNGSWVMGQGLGSV